MNIVFSNTIFFLQKKGGISRYYTNLCKEFKKIKINSKIIAPISKNIYLKNLKQNNISFYLSSFPNNVLLKKLNYFLFRFFLKKENPDIIHETYYDKDNLKILKDKLKILTVYDLAHENFASLYSKKKLLEKKNILEYVDHFICISKKTQKDFTKHYKIPLYKTSVIYLGCDHLKKNSKKELGIKLPRNYFLYVGSRDNYKNFKLLAEAVNSSKKFRNIKVICFGGGKFSQDEIKKYKLSDNFINYQGSDNLLTYLYIGAIAFINTSKYEGFGIPNIEAMHLGCPVISSDFEALREVGGNACLYFKNDNYLDLLKKINFFLLYKEARKIFIKKGHKRSKLFTWKNCAKQTKDLYKNLI